MVSDRGENGSRRGNSLLRFAAGDDLRPRAGGTYVSLGIPRAEPNSAEVHRRARSRRERVENAYLAELAARPGPEPEQPQRQPVRAEPAPVRRTAHSVLDQFARIDAAIAARARGKAAAQGADDEGADGTEEEFTSARAAPEAWRPLIDPQHIISAVRDWRIPIVGLGLLGGLLGGMAALSTPKFYYASAELWIDPRGLKVIDNGVSPDGFVSDTFAIVDSQARLITSPDVLETVVKDLGLEKDAEFNGELNSSWFEALRGIVMRVDAGSDKSIAATEYLADHVYVERGAKTYVINVTSASADPEKAAEIANKLVAVYMDKQRKQQSATVQQTTDELTARLAALKQSVEEAEQAVETYKSENDLIGVEGRLIDDEAILRVNDQLSAAKGQTINLNARAKSIKSLTPESFVDGGMEGEITSPALTGLRGQYSTAKQKRDGLATKLGPRHPERIQADSELDSLRASIAAEIRRVSASMQADLRRAIQTEQDLAAHLAELKVRQGRSGSDLVRLRELQREAAAKSQVYESFLLRAKQTGEQINLNTADIKVISARVPKEPAGTSRKLIAVGGLLGGLGLGLAFAVLKGIVASLAAQMGNNGRARAPMPAPAPDGGGGGMFQPLRRRPAPDVSGPAPSHILPREALAQARAAAAEERAPQQGQSETPRVLPHPAPQPPSPPQPPQFWQPHLSQPQVAAPALQPAFSPAAQPTQYWQPHLSQPQAVPAALQPAPQPSFPPAPLPPQYWQPQPQPTQLGHVPPGPMMYPQQLFAPPAFAQPAFAPQPVLAPQPQSMSIWQQPAPWAAVQPPVQLQMPLVGQQPAFFAPAPAEPAAAPAPHPFAQEAEQNAARAEAAPGPRARAGDRLSQIQESIDEFRSALTSFATQRRAS